MPKRVREEVSATGERLEDVEPPVVTGRGQVALKASEGKSGDIIFGPLTADEAEEAAAREVLRTYRLEIDRQIVEIATVQKQIELGWSAIHRNMDDIQVALRRLQAA